MSTRVKNLFRVMSLFVLVVSFIPVNQVVFAATTTLPPANMFQLPWDQGLSWVAIDGIDNTTERPASSSHNYLLGGAIDFAPHNNMITGENTSNFWVAAAAAGTVVGISSCHIILDHGNGWLTQYQFLGNIQVKLGDVVAQNQRLGIIADGVRIKYCPGSVDPNVPHLHFMLRPTMIGATFAGWLVKYNWFWNNTTFTRNGVTVGLYKPLLNTLIAPTPTPTLVPTETPGPGTASVTPGPGTPSATPVSTQPSATATLPSSITDTPVATTTGATDTPTPTAASGPYATTVVSQPNLGVGDTTTTTVSLNNVPAEGFTSAEFTCTYDATLLEASNIVIGTLFGADAASIINGPQNGKFIVAIAGSHGNKDTTNGVAFTFDVKALQAGQTTINCTARVSTGSNILTDLPSSGSAVTILAETLTPTSQPLPTDTPAPTQTLAATDTPFATLAPTQTPIAGWLTFTNATFGYQFQYPAQGQIQSGSNDGDTIIKNLPIVQSGTNLAEKYMEVAAGANATDCKSLFQTQDPGVTVTINGINFLKQTGGDGAAGSLYQWVAYSTLKDGVCVSVNFILHSIDPGVFTTPPPLFDYVAESAIFDQIIATYVWLAQSPTATPDVSATPAFTATPVASPTLAVTATPTMFMSPTPSGGNGAITSQVTAGKPVTINVYDSSSTLVATAQTQPYGSFYLEVPPGDYTAVASASGFLQARANVASLNAGITRILPPITLLAGDIDGNNVIDQFDALTIGMNYNGTTPSAADLNNDGIINVLDLELLAENYRDTGPTVWQ